jgi:phosphate uptake regulator
MKRKIIKQGHNTLTITLPRKWADQFKLKAGNEVDLVERENGFLITTEKNEEKKIAEFDISGMNIPTIWKYFMVVYREGYDEVKVMFRPEESHESPYKYFVYHQINGPGQSKQRTSFETIQEMANRFIGFEIIEHHKNYCIIKDMVQLSTKEFDSSFRRVFLLILQMSEELLEAVKTNNIQNAQYINDMDINVDKFNDYCVRVMNKTGFKDAQSSQILFTTLFMLEMLADELKSIANHLIKSIKCIRVKNLLTMAEMTNDQLRDYYELYYNFDKKKLIQLSERDLKTHLYIPEMYHRPGKTSLNDEELEILNHFRRVVKAINSLIELRIELEF